MKLLMENWRKHLNEAYKISGVDPRSREAYTPGETSLAKLKEPGMEGYWSGERKIVDIPADYGKEERTEEKDKSNPDIVRVLKAYWDDEEEEIKAYYDEVKEAFEGPDGILAKIESASADDRRVALDNIQQRQEPEDPAPAPAVADRGPPRLSRMGDAGPEEYYGAKSKR
jgi:hypothetical protein